MKLWIFKKNIWRNEHDWEKNEVRLKYVNYEPKTIYNASYENKEVRAYFIDNEICINWYIDGRLIEKSRFPKESVDEIYKFMQSLHYKDICENLIYKILHTLEKYLPYLEDGENPIGSLKFITITGEVKL